MFEMSTVLLNTLLAAIKSGKHGYITYTLHAYDSRDVISHKNVTSNLQVRYSYTYTFQPFKTFYSFTHMSVTCNAHI